MQLLRSIIIVLSVFSVESRSKQPLMLYIPGARGHRNSKNSYADNKLLMYSKDKVYSFDFNDIKDGKYKRSKCGMGQEEDMQVLSENYATICNQYEEVYHEKPKVVLFGLCRGGVTAINFKKPDNLAALVVESPYSHAYDFVPWLPVWLKRIFIGFVYSKFKSDGDHAIDHIKEIKDEGIPIAFICSKEDTFLSYQSTLNLYNKLIDLGHTKAHILILENGRHAKITDNPEYRNFVNAFYKKYDLPFDPKSADAGAKYFVL